MMSALVSAMLPGCQFPDYGMAAEGGGNAGAPASGGSSGSDPVGSSGESGEGGSDAGAGAGTGAGAGAGAGGAGGMDEPEPTPCTQTCVPLPSGWQGPMAFWEDLATVAPPECPAGFDSKPTDVHHELVAPDGLCTCTCAPAEGQVCDTILHIYPDQACGSSQCAQVGTRVCTAVPAACTGSQGTTSIDALTISGGSCRAQVVKPAPPTWKYNDRLCESSDLGACAEPNTVCARMPDLPYLSSLCVTRQVQNDQQLPTCPAAYPNQVTPLYGQYLDGRDCSECTCGAPSGGTCTGKITISGGNECQSTGGGEYVLSTAGNPAPICQKFNLGAGGLRPNHVMGYYTLNPPGTCAVTTKSEPTGEATTAGMVTVVCCQSP